MIIAIIILLILIRWFLDGAGYKSGRKYRIDSKGRRRFK